MLITGTKMRISWNDTPYHKTGRTDMTERNKKELDELYTLYEFEKHKEMEGCSIYIYEQGYFNNAEIVTFRDFSEEYLAAIKAEYSEVGFSVSLRKGGEYEKIKRELFNGFFKVKLSNKKVLKEYSEYCNKQTKHLGGNEYSFIKLDYLHNGVLREESIVEEIVSKMNQDGAQLVILEAPAGFGKTCTAYEISRSLALKNEAKVPILAELSKNRSASIFSYVLLSEIDRKFPRLSSGLVTEQIREGNIPLIIDGFDELLSKSLEDDEKTLEEAKTMLDTIANLFSEGSNAKILLTSRKSAIFAGDIFDEWVESKLGKCEVNRIQILNPTVKNWIGYEKKQYFEDKGINIDNVANPVLLSMLRNETLESCRKNYEHSYDILNRYFTLLLEREKERQALLIPVEEQKSIMRKLAAVMVELNISSDERDGIQALIEDIVSPKMANYLSLYHNYGEDSIPPTEEQFIAKITDNALLDRVSVNSNKVGFINEFIFGILIGDALIAKDLKAKELSEKYLNMVLTAYAAECEEKRKELYHIIDSDMKSVEAGQSILLEMKMLGEIRSDFIEDYFSGIDFDKEVRFQNVFLNCTFDNCVFNENSVENSVFQGCTFINTTFYHFDILKDSLVEHSSVFLSCRGHENIQEALTIADESVADENDEYYERLVLEQFWMKGSSAAEPRKTRRTLLKGIKQNDRLYVNAAIERLIDNGVIKPLTYCMELNFSKLTEIKRILGR